VHALCVRPKVQDDGVFAPHETDGHLLDRHAVAVYPDDAFACLRGFQNEAHRKRLMTLDLRRHLHIRQ
jgi:hypothetical protein